MNIKDTETFLTMLWTLFPNAPRLTPADRKATVMTWFLALSEYTIADAWAGAQRAMKAQPRFIPTAFEVEHYAEKTLDVERFLPVEFSTVSHERTRTLDRYNEICDMVWEQTPNGTIKHKVGPDEAQEYFDLGIKIDSLNRDISRMMDTAKTLALKAYDAATQERITNDPESRTIFEFTGPHGHAALNGEEGYGNQK